MVKQYPHYLFVVVGSEAKQNDDGEWESLPPAPSEGGGVEFVSVCREETNGRGNELKVGGGLFYRYSSLVHLPKGCPNVDEGATVFVSEFQDGTGLRIKGQTLKFDKGQLHSRLWIN